MNINVAAIKQMLEAATCPQHHKHPQVTIELGKIEIVACCEPFRASVEQAANQEYVRAIDGSLHDVLENSESDL